MEAVVCEDVSRQRDIGTVITGPGNVDLAKRKGCIVLPFDVELPALASVGYVQTHYGEGWVFSRNAGERGCSTMIFVTPACRFIYWAARVEPVDPNTPMQGTLRMIHSSESTRGMGVGMNQIKHVERMPEVDERGGAYVFGKGGFSPSEQGFLVVDLYAVGQFRVKWLALTQHRDDYAV